MNPLRTLTTLGSSVWIDGLVDPSELERLVRDDGVTGLTSNPTIFRAAVLGDEHYERRIAALHAIGPDAVYEALAVDDVRAAADVLGPVYERTGGEDGYVSLEVAPALAHDADATIAAARDLWTKVDRPNAMIKIPATPAGVAASRWAVAAGINVNVTLLFSVAAYEAVIDAYLGGLEDRTRAGLPVDGIASVASFFVSRVDTAVDRELTRLGRADLRGRAAVANARAAFARALELFGGERFAALAALGARPQKPLWASTATKDARYSDVKYVAELAGPGAVMTLPPATLAAFRDHGVVSDGLTGTAGLAAADLRTVTRAGVDLDVVTSRLLEEGLKAFAESMDQLLAGLLAGVIREELS